MMPKFIPRFVSAPKAPYKCTGAVSSIDLPHATLSTPDATPKINLPIHMVAKCLIKVKLHPMTAIISQKINVFLLP
jgi:hypothetical protein